jgi:small subunit ribosomal protein S1
VSQLLTSQMAEEKINEQADEATVDQAAEVQAEQTPAAPVEEAPKAKAEKAPKAPKAAPAAPVEFDWSAMGKRQQMYSPAQRAEMESMYDGTLKSINEHDVMMGRVVSKTSKDYIVNIGFKSEGIIPISELRYTDALTVGSEIEVYVERTEDKNGQLVLSHKKARALKSWERINRAMEDDEIITGQIKCRTKGGLIADVFGIEAFLPGSQIDVKPIRDYDQYVGKTMEFKVVKINQEFKNVVVSHKALIQAELELQKKEIMSKLEKGQILEGTVKNITSYGVFVDLGGVDGLIHITDLSWGRISHPEEIVQLDSKINVVILDFDDEKKRIALGLKQLSGHPWDEAAKDINVGDKIKGKVVVIADYGAFVELAPGVEGLLHVSEMSWSQHLRSAQDFLKVGQEIECAVLNIDREERKMSLGLKQLKTDPWTEVTTKYPVNSQHSGKVRNFTTFGIFVELEEGIDGLVHISDLSWEKKIKHPSEFTTVGADLDVVVLDIDVENRRLSLGHKQLQENPWDVFETVFSEGTTHKGTITSFNDKGAVIALPYGIEGYCYSKQLVKADASKAKTEEALDFVVVEFNKEAKRVVVSHLRTYAEDPEDERTVKKNAASTSKGVKKVKDSLEKTTLGDLEALSNLKEAMEKGAKAKTTKKKKAEEESSDEE